MADGISTDVLVKRMVRDGWHIYTCDLLPGLFVADQDDRVAYNDIPKSIRTLLKLDFGLDCEVTHKIDYASFIMRARLRERATAEVTERTKELTEAVPETFSFTLQTKEAALAAR